MFSDAFKFEEAEPLDCTVLGSQYFRVPVIFAILGTIIGLYYVCNELDANQHTTGICYSTSLSYHCILSIFYSKDRLINMKGSKIMLLFYLIILHQLFNGLFLFHVDDFSEWRKTSSVILSSLCVICTSYMTIGLCGAVRANSVKVVSHNIITYVNGVGSSANYMSCGLTIVLYIFAISVSVYVSWDPQCTN
jgi:hypothetical protein